MRRFPENNNHYQQFQERDFARRRSQRTVEIWERRCIWFLLPLMIIAALLQAAIIVYGFTLWMWYLEKFDNCTITLSTQPFTFQNYLKLGTVAVALTQLVLFESSNSNDPCRATCERLISLVGTIGLLIYLSCFVVGWYFLGKGCTGNLGQIFSLLLISGFVSIVSPGPLLMIYVCFSRCCCFYIIRSIYCCFPSLLKIQGLRVRYKQSKGVDEICVICWEPLQSEASIVEIESCNHAFHRACLLQWLEYQTTCPLCRGNVPCWHLSLPSSFNNTYSLCLINLSTVQRWRFLCRATLEVSKGKFLLRCKQGRFNLGMIDFYIWLLSFFFTLWRV